MILTRTAILNATEYNFTKIDSCHKIKREKLTMIGIMADSHDNLNFIRSAVDLFNRIKCSLVIHAGDFIAPFSAKELENMKCPVKAVFGNCDGEKKGLSKAIVNFGEIRESPFVFNHANLNFLLLHVPFDINSHLKSGQYDLIIHGHTHNPLIEKQGKSLLINPGETGGWVSGKSTVALLDESNLTVEIISL
jgi:putative phosphoesterase